MEQFLLNNYLFINNGVAFVAPLFGLICFSKYKDSKVKYFIYFLLYVAIMQCIGSYPDFVEDYEFLSPLKKIIEGTLFEKNYWIFTLFWSFGSALFYSFYFHSILSNKQHKVVIRILTYLFIASTIIYIIMKPEELFNQMIPFIKIFGALVILLCAIFYFMKILKSNEVLNFYKSMNFYISATIFIWWLVTTPVTFYQVYYSAADWSFVFLRWQIFLFMNIFMYISFAFAFVWCKPDYE